MTHSAEFQTSSSERGSAASEFVLLAAPTVLAATFALGLVVAADAKLEATANAAALAQKLAAADAITTSDTSALLQVVKAFTFGIPLKQVVAKTEDAVSVCYDFETSLGISHACWHSFSEPR